MEKDITINPSRPTRRSLIPTSSTLVTEPYVPVRDRKPPLPSRPPPSPSSLIPMPNNKTGSKSEVTMSFRSRNTVKFTANAFSALNNKVYCNKNDSNVSHQDQQGNVDKEEGESNVMTSTSISVAELATRFLEENVRKCIKPRIFPMENTSFLNERVPTPFVFTSSEAKTRRIHETHRQCMLQHDTDTRSSPLVYPRYINPQLDVISNSRIFRRNAVFSENRSATALAVSISSTRSSSAGLVAMSASNSQSHSSSPTKKILSQNGSDFSSLLKKWSAPIPPALSRKLGRASDSPLGKVKVMLRVCDNAEEVNGGILGVDQRRKQVTLIDPGVTGPTGITPEERRVGVSAPKMFAFDGIFSEDDDQGEICATSAAELVASVVGGEDGCLVSLGYCTAGKRHTMFGKPVNQKIGVVPTAISWLFKSIQEQRQKLGTRFSIRVSAVEVTGASGHELINDLLMPFANDGDQPPASACLLDTGTRKSVTASILNTVSEVRAPNPETAGFFLDAALNSLSSNNGPNKEEVNGGGGGVVGVPGSYCGGHFVFTLHVYQYSIDKNGKGVVGGRSRLHCVLLGNGSPSISVLSGLLLAVLNGQRHLPSSNHSKLGAILRECLGSLTCRAVVMIHVSDSHSRYAETLAALQLGSRVHRLRRSRRLKMGSVGSGTGSGGSSGGSGEEMRSSGLPPPLLGTTGGPGGGPNQICEGETGSSDVDPSSSEQSCDTVIYLGPSIDEATDGEHPPVYLPSLEGENGCESKILATKCSASNLLNGNVGQHHSNPPKTKSPKPHKSGEKMSSSEFTSNKEEQWVDGPKVSSKAHRALAQPSPSKSKKGETWIDGPAARVNHQASNFPSPKKTPFNHSPNPSTTPISANQSHKLTNGRTGCVGGGDSCCGISSTKAEMIQKWISNQTNSSPDSFFDDLSHLAEDVLLFGGPKGCSNFGGCKQQQHHHQHQQQQPVSHCNGGSGTRNNGYPGSLHQQMMYEQFFSPPNEPEYKALTIFKTCEDEEEDEPKGEQMMMNGVNGNNEYEVEFIEVVEPEIPVPTKDVCLQVTEEDIALSFLEEENPLPESDQNFAMASEIYFARAKSASFSTDAPLNVSSYASLPRMDKRGGCNGESEMNHQEGRDHPLRVLSQECLTVVSTFTDSLTINAQEVERFWPSLSYNDILLKSSCASGDDKMCNGLCKNLATLSQMSLDSISNCNNEYSAQNFLCSSESESARNEAHYDSNPCHNNGPRKLYEHQEPLNHKPPTGKQLVLRSPPTLTSPEFKVPPVPKPRVSSLSIHSNVNGKGSRRPQSGAVSGSDAEQETLSIPPMELLDVNQIKNNCNPMDPVTASPKMHPKLSSQTSYYPGCGHDHRGSIRSMNGGVLKEFNNGGSGSSGSPSSHSILSESSRMTPPSSPCPVVPILISEKVVEASPSPPSKSKSRKIAKFFRSRSKSPKKLVAMASKSGGSESEKSSSDGVKGAHSSTSSASSCSSGASLPPTLLSKPKSPKHTNSPNKKLAPMKVHSCFSTSTTSSISSDYQFTCDSALPIFLPNPMLKPV